jgi:hypothetical protein
MAIEPQRGSGMQPKGAGPQRGLPWEADAASSRPVFGTPCGPVRGESKALRPLGAWHLGGADVGSQVPRGASPVARREPPVAWREPPMAWREPPVARREPPVARREPPVAWREPPVARREPPVARREPPVARREPPVARREPPMARREPPRGVEEAPRGVEGAPRTTVFGVWGLISSLGAENEAKMGRDAFGWGGEATRPLG